MDLSDEEITSAPPPTSTIDDSNDGFVTSNKPSEVKNKYN